MSLPMPLADLLDTLAMFTDPVDRATLLIGYADKFREVPPTVATRPFPESHKVPHCESDAYVWVQGDADKRVTLYFAVENPSGVSARALAAILDSTLSGLPAGQVAHVTPDIVERIFRQNMSMGKGMGLMSMVGAVQALARRVAAGQPG